MGCHTVVLHRTAHVNALRRRPEPAQVLRVLRRLRDEQRNLLHKPSRQSAEKSIALETPRTHPSVNDRYRNRHRFGARKEIRPHFALGQNDEIRPHRTKGPTHCPGKIEGPHDHIAIGEVLAGLVEAGIRGGGNDDVPVGVATAKGGYDSTQQVNLTHADAVKPHDPRVLSFAFCVLSFKRGTEEFRPQIPTVFPRRQRLVDQPR